MARGKMQIRLVDVQINGEAILAMIQQQIEKGLVSKVGPHFVDSAKAKAPVSDERDASKSRRALQPLKLRPLGSFPKGERADRLFDLHGMTASERGDVVRASDAQFFEGTGDNKGRSPDRIEPVQGTVKGAFAHRPGTLRDSIRMGPVRRVGRSVVLDVIAHAPYAAAVHQGFTHRGGRNHQGKATKIPARPFFKQAVPAIKDDIKNPATWAGKG